MKPIKVFKFNILIILAVALCAFLAIGHFAFADTYSTSNGCQYSDVTPSSSMISPAACSGTIQAGGEPNMMGNDSYYYNTGVNNATQGVTDYNSYYVAYGNVIMMMPDGTLQCSTLTLPSPSPLVPAGSDVAVYGGIQTEGPQPTSAAPTSTVPTTQFTITSWYQINQ